MSWNAHGKSWRNECNLFQRAHCTSSANKGKIIWMFKYLYSANNIVMNNVRIRSYNDCFFRCVPEHNRIFYSFGCVESIPLMDYRLLLWSLKRKCVQTGFAMHKSIHPLCSIKKNHMQCTKAIFADARDISLIKSIKSRFECNDTKCTRTNDFNPIYGLVNDACVYF